MRLNPRFGRFSGHLAVGNGRRMRQVEGRSARICWLSGPQPATLSFIGFGDPADKAVEQCGETCYLRRTQFESIAVRKPRRRQLPEDGNVEITGGIFGTGAFRLRSARDRGDEDRRPTSACQTPM
jgi:hypothetical protein